MQPIWDRTQAGRPHTHAFILGIGAYPHVPGGVGSPAAEDYGLGQLTSPPESARAFADWLLNEFQQPEAPLGTVELLLSELQPRPYALPTGEQVQPQPATMANIRTAFLQWFERCNSRPDNSAVFYFCGHGVMVQLERILLAADFGANHQLPFEHALNFDKLYRGMAHCQARVQSYFVDACRQVPLPGIDLQEIGAAVLLPVRVRGQCARDTLILNASAADDRAYAQPNRVSRFTQALLDSLRGRGSKKVGGRWVVTTARLGEAVPALVERLNLIQGGPIQQSTRDGEGSGKTPLCVLPAPPTVPMRLHFDPSQALEDADLSLTSVVHPSSRYRRGPGPGDWERDDIIADHYTLQATFRTGRYRDVADDVLVLPPLVDEAYTLEVNR